MLVSEIHYTLDQNLQILNSFVYSNFLPEEINLQFDRIVDKYIDAHLKAAPIGSLQGIDEIQIDLDNLRYLKVVDTPISLTNGVGVLPTNYRNLLQDRSLVMNCGRLTEVANRLYGDEDLSNYLENPFTKTVATSPISRIYGNNIRIYQDNFTVNTCKIDYIRKPISLNSLNPSDDYTEFPDYCIKVIIDLLRNRMLEIVQSQRLPSAVQETNNFGTL